MSVQITITDTNVGSYLAGLAAKADNPTAIWDAVGNDLAELVRLNFNDGTDPYGNAWAHPVFRDGQPLRDTGRLMNSITHQADASGVSVGTNVIYGATHQAGATITAKNKPLLRFKTPKGWISKKSVTIPARPFLPTAEQGLPYSWRMTIMETAAEKLGVKK